MRQLAGNIGLLLPVGLIGPVLMPRLERVRSVLFAALALSAGIELVQSAGTASTFIERSVDVDDLILNVAGALLGWLLWYGACAVFKPAGDASCGSNGNATAAS